jgi:hypothetical protein
LDYEGTAKSISLPANIGRTIEVRHRFKLSHGAIKLQIDIQEVVDGTSCDVSVESLAIHETIPSTLARLGSSSSDIKLRDANRLFRSCDYLAAMGYYAVLSQKNGLGVYLVNYRNANRVFGNRLSESDESLFLQNPKNFE